jgi:hypothetical protein
MMKVRFNSYKSKGSAVLNISVSADVLCNCMQIFVFKHPFKFNLLIPVCESGFLKMEGPLRLHGQKFRWKIYYEHVADLTGHFQGKWLNFHTRLSASIWYVFSL